MEWIYKCFDWILEAHRDASNICPRLQSQVAEISTSQIVDQFINGAFWWTFGVGAVLSILCYSFLKKRFQKRVWPIKFAAIILVIIIFVVATLTRFGGLNNYGVCFAIPCLACVLGIVSLLCYFVLYLKSKRGKCRVMQYTKYHRLAAIMYMVWSIGWIMYFVAIILSDAHQPFEVLIYSAVNSLDTFLMDFNGNLMDSISHCPNLKLLIVMDGACAVGCTFVLLFLLIYSRFKEYLRLRTLKFGENNKYIYIFFGFNTPSKFLAKSIIEEKKNEADYSIIFIESPLDSEESDELNGWDKITKLFTHKHSTFDTLKELDSPHCYLAISNVSINKIKNLDEAGLMGLVVKFKKLKGVNWAKLHLFFLSDNREENTRNALAVASSIDRVLYNDPSEKNAPLIYVYCQTRFYGISRNFENMALAKNIIFKVIDNSHLSVETLKTDEKNHPINFVDIDTTDNPGTVKSPFTSLVMGFGETGRDAVRFLYEYGAFVDSASTQEQTMRSPFYCHIVDKDVANLCGRFKASNPAIFGKGKYQQNGMNLIEFHEMDYNSESFYDLLDKIAKDLNYVVISLGSDETNIEVAEKVLFYVRRKRGSLRKFKIFVRVYEDGSFLHVSKMANHFNYILKGESDNQEIIKLFGCNTDVYSYSVIVDNKFEKDAQEYYKAYREIQGNASSPTDEGDWNERRKCLLGLLKKKTDYKTWTSVFEECRQDASCANLDKLRRKESQDLSNAQHAQTKMHIIKVFYKEKLSTNDQSLQGEAIIKQIRRLWYNRLSQGRTNGLLVKPEYKEHLSVEQVSALKNKELTLSGMLTIEAPITYIVNPKGSEVDKPHNLEGLYEQESKLIQNLAILEHMRWVASHELMGYEINNDKHRCDEVTKKHNCMRPWEALDAESMSSSYIEPDFLNLQEGELCKAIAIDYKAYDFVVVETSVKLYLEEEEKKTKKDER